MGRDRTLGGPRLRSIIGHGVILAVLLGAAPARAAPAVSLGKISAKLFYNELGSWSPDLLAKSTSWTGWNTVIGEGDAGGAAEDVMIAVALSAPGAEDAVTTEVPLTIVAKAGKKVLGTRMSKFTLIPHGGVSHLPLYLADASCAGRIDIVATFGKQVRKARLNMDCGE